MRAEVLDRHGVDLAFEVEFVGDWTGWEVRAVSARPPLVVLLGGPSAEHDVSIVSGTAIAAALADEGHAVEQVLIDLDGGWWWLPPGHARDDRPAAAYDDPATLGARPARSRSGPPSTGWPPRDRRRWSSSPSTARSARTAPSRRCSRQPVSPTPDRAWRPRRSGWTRRSSSGSAAGSACRSSDWREIGAARWANDPAAVRAELAAFAAAAGDPRLMVKPARLGSSVGMTLVHDPAELDRALATAFRHDTLVLAETYLPGARDLEVSVIGNGPADLELFGPGEIISGHEFYDYEAKYTAGLSETSTRAEVTDRQRATIQKIARDAYRAIGAEGFARIDFLLAGETIVLSEINTIPGFTPISLFPTMPAEGGYTFGGVCSRIVELAIERHAGRARRTPDHRRTCLMTYDERSSSGAPQPRAAPRPPVAACPPGVGRPVAGPRRGGPGDARVGGCDLRRGRLVRLRLPDPRGHRRPVHRREP